MSIKVTSSGDFSKTYKYLNKLSSFKKQKLMSILNKYGQEGVKKLANATPIDTGETASRWRYEIEEKGNDVSLIFINDNMNEGIPVVVLIQYGHGTGTGGYVPPNDFINPVIKPIFQKLADEAWKEVRAL